MILFLCFRARAGWHARVYFLAINFIILRIRIIFLRCRAPGPDPPAGWRTGLASNDEAVLPGLINNIDIAIFAEEVAPGRAGQA